MLDTIASPWMTHLIHQRHSSHFRPDRVRSISERFCTLFPPIWSPTPVAVRGTVTQALVGSRDLCVNSWSLQVSPASPARSISRK